MNTTKRNSGNWGPQQDKELGDLLRSNQVDYRSRNGDYLFEVTGKGGKQGRLIRTGPASSREMLSVLSHLAEFSFTWNVL